MDSFRVTGGASRAWLRMGDSICSGVISCRAVCSFTDKAKSSTETTALFSRGLVESIDVHSIWITRGARVHWAGVLIGSERLGAISLVCEGDLSCYLSLEAEVGGFFIPRNKSGGYCIHGLDAMHYPGRVLHLARVGMNVDSRLV